MHAKHTYNLFDLDGTLTDPALGITNSVMYALEKSGYPVPERQELYKFIGPPLVYSFKTYSGMNDEEAERALWYYRERFSAGGLFENEIYEGIPELLADLKAAGGRVILATGKPEEFAAQILEHFGILQYFDFVAGNTLEETRPEKRQVLEHIFRNFPELSKDNAVMVGDRRFDVEAAADFSIPGVGVLFGFGTRAELESAGAARIAETVKELRGCLIED